MFKLALSGSTGRMGSSIKKVLQEDSELKTKIELTAELNKKNSIEDWSPEEIDFVIDFSNPDVFREVWDWCQKYKKPLLSGTTGFESLKNIREKKTDVPFMYSGNYSLGIASLLKSLHAFKSFSENAQVWIEDYHHIHKLDAPSGTALKIGKYMKDLFSKEPKINDVRAGSIFGVHKIHMATDKEWITLTHQALKREVFAEGALRTALWVKDEKPDHYEMEDYLNKA